MDAQHEQEDVQMQQGDEQPRSKRKLSRLSHMAVNKAAAGQTQELHHKSSAAAAGFNTGSNPHTYPEGDLQDTDDAAADPDVTAPALRSPNNRQHQNNGSVQDATVEAAEEPAAAFVCEPPSVAANDQRQASQQSLPQAGAMSAGTAASPAETGLPGEAHRVNLDEEEDDEWEDQPAHYINEAADMLEGAAEVDQVEAALSQGKTTAAACTAAEYNPSSRRRELYDDEDEWEQLVMKQKAKGSQSNLTAADGGEGNEQQASAANSASGQEENDDDSILAEDPDDTNAATQRLLRDSAHRDGLGKGFKDEVVPLNSLLGKLAARQAALEARAKQRTPAAQQHQPPAITLEQLKAHLEQHSLDSKQLAKQQGRVQAEAAAPGASHAISEGLQHADIDAECTADLDDDLDDELVLEPAQQQAAAGSTAADSMLPPDTQQLFGELQLLPQRQPVTGDVVVGSELCAATADELELQLEDDVEEGGRDGHTNNSSKDPQVDEDMAEVSEELQDCMSDEEDREVSGSGSEGEEQELEESSEVSGSEAAEDESLQQQSEELAEPEPLHWEEEEEDAAGPSSSSQQEGAAPGLVSEGAADVMKSSRGGKGGRPQRQGAAGGFVEAEADLSDDEGHEDDGESDDDDDAMLVELIAEVKEGRMDESRRADLHAKWMAGKDARDMKDLLQALKRGFRKKKKAGAGLDEDEDDGTDAAARRRRAQLLGTLDDDDEEEEAAPAGTDRLKRLDFQWQEEEHEIQAAAAALAAELANREKQKKIHELQLQASESQDGEDVMQLLQMDFVDEDSQHTAALLSKAASAPAAAGATAQGSNIVRSTLRLAGCSMPAQPRLASSKPKQQTRLGLGPDAAAAASAVPDADGSSKAGSGGGGFSFQMFGKDLTNSSKQQGTKKQVAGSFIGRQASASVSVRAASNYGASRSFVFGSDPSNHSNPAAREQPGDGTAAVGPASFAGLTKLIAEGPAQGSAAGLSRLGHASGGGGGQDSSLLQVLGGKKGATSVAGGSSKLHMDAVGTKFKAAGNSRAGGDSNAATLRGGPWQF